MSASPLVSVVIPTRNRADFLQGAVDSALSQTHSPIEVIVVDDASTDSTRERMEKLSSRHAQVRYLRNQEARGASAARNVGIRQSKGELVAFLDDDDTWMPQKLAEDVAFLRANSSLSAVSSHHLQAESWGTRKIERPRSVSMQALLRANTLGGFSVCTVRRQVFDRVGLLDESLPSCQDWDFWIRLAREGLVGVLDRCLTTYVVHEGARIGAPGPARLRGRQRIREKYESIMDDSTRRHHVHNLAYERCLIEGATPRGLREFLRVLALTRPTRLHLVMLADVFGRAFVPRPVWRGVLGLRNRFRRDGLVEEKWLAQ